MFNEWLWGGFAIVNFAMILAIYKIFGKPGLFVWIGMSTVVANIQVLKTVELFGITATLGNIIYGTAFLATDILNEKYGKKDAKKAVWLGFFTLIAMTVMMQIALQFTPAESDTVQGSLVTLFSLVPKVALGSLAAYLISQYFDVWIFSKLKSKFPDDKYLWLRNNGSTMISQLLDSAVFCTIAFSGMPLNIWLEIFISTYVIKFIVSFLDTPFFYIAKKMKTTN
ncbi:queuosine precursor transporter [Salinibacillus xinjiangensis]|uniref:Probable queuosine precursor transporter n=1 Tax=Salinibacillus xinjiangensis TaxID=1229268 RepID=A0A6G1XBJ1_9BACI|nr:queuosine precursor transporter [Salinibacillus xinjiangensis]MRG88302.1 queuosine precursor transporter [Salinibacillus xinjiangensis]